MKILIVGDIFSKMGRESFERNLKKLKREENINFIIVNGENTSHGKGLNEKHYKWFMELGVNVITMGNHTYSNRNIYNFIDDSKSIVRPANFSQDLPGVGYTTKNYNGIKITVMQFIGKVFMNNPNDEDPFEKTQALLDSIDSNIFICDFHAEATSEKVAFGHCFDGKIQIIYGTHTHVQTNDARILPKGSAYITDVGMTGAMDGVIGVQKNIIIDRYLKKSTNAFEPEDKGKAQFCAIIVEIDEKTFKCQNIKVLNIIE
ncbi:MAG: TIGR00282 family metallophosphoesterase [Bacilli bacterium]|nr:TIGR00282 family metallophosphoesterase [Bacilli bacterium]